MKTNVFRHKLTKGKWQTVHLSHCFSWFFDRQPLDFMPKFGLPWQFFTTTWLCIISFTNSDPNPIQGIVSRAVALIWPRQDIELQMCIEGQVSKSFKSILQPQKLKMSDGIAPEKRKITPLGGENTVVGLLSFNRSPWWMRRCNHESLWVTCYRDIQECQFGCAITNQTSIQQTTWMQICAKCAGLQYFSKTSWIFKDDPSMSCHKCFAALCSPSFAKMLSNIAQAFWDETHRRS